MANESQSLCGLESENFLQVSPTVGGGSSLEGASLESTSAESGCSIQTQIEVQSISELKVVEETSSQDQIKATLIDAKEEGRSDEAVEDQSSSSPHFTPISTQRANDGSLSRDDDGEEEQYVSLYGESSASSRLPNLKSVTTTKDNYYERDDERIQGDEYEEEKEYDQSFEEDTISSEAVVDDIELILMPEMVQDFQSSDLSPQLVRVTELNKRQAYNLQGIFDEDETDQEGEESDFKKFGTDDEEGNVSEVSATSSKKFNRKTLVTDNEPASHEEDYLRDKSRGKVNSGVQTEITALETTSIALEIRRKSGGKSSSGKSGLPAGKRLNWKSELTLLPSKTKIKPSGGFGSGYEAMNYHDQFTSPRVAKFTSQDMLSSSSQFLKPTTLYRTQNLSRNLNHCASSDSTLSFPVASTSDSARLYNPDRISSSTSATFKEDACYRSSMALSGTRSRQPLSGQVKGTFRTSLPDLSSSPRGTGGSTETGKGHRRGGFKFTSKQQRTSSGYRLAKKSSSDDDTSSLIDESERCLRSSIDMLLTDDLPSPGTDLSCRSACFGGATASTSHGGYYYSSRRSRSQPLLMDEGDNGDSIRNSTMGSPFLPRKLSDMRVSKWAKVILPNGHVGVVAVKEMDELRDVLTVHTDTGCILCLPFRKVVFAWRSRY